MPEHEGAGRAGALCHVRTARSVVRVPPPDEGGARTAELDDADLVRPGHRRAEVHDLAGVVEARQRTREPDGDGQRYRGRGLIQITGRNNYLRCSLALFGDERLLRTPELLELPQWAAESAAWFWWVRELNALADRNEFEAITRKINGGLNGLADRLQLWERARAVLCVLPT